MGCKRGIAAAGSNLRRAGYICVQARESMRAEYIYTGSRTQERSEKRSIYREEGGQEKGVDKEEGRKRRLPELSVLISIMLMPLVVLSVLLPSAYPPSPSPLLVLRFESAREEQEREKEKNQIYQND